MLFNHYWYQSKLHPFLLPLLPLSFLFCGLVYARRQLYNCGLKKSHTVSLPIIVVGNISVGGTGKTPFVIWLVKLLKAQGFKPGIATRGFGGKKLYQPCLVVPDSDVRLSGDESLLLAQSTNCPVVVCIDRVAAVKELQKQGCDLVICDDGLQHYRLARDLEIAVIDGNRHFGNGFLLPAGPLREGRARLKEVDFTVVNGLAKTSVKLLPRLSSESGQMQMKMDTFVSLANQDQKRELSAFAGKKVHALAGIGNPERFFAMLHSLKIDFIPHVFSDHHPYQAEDFNFSEALPIVMTEKDAVKCLNFAKEEWWFLRVSAELNSNFETALLTKIRGISK